MYCIQESDKPNFIFRLFNIISLIDNKIILPISKDGKISERKALKLAKKTKKILEKTISKKIIISKAIKKQEKYMNILKNGNFEIVDGRWLFEVLICEVLDYIIEFKGMKKEMLSVSILVNNISENVIEAIRKIAKEYKRLNIVTNYMEKFKKIEEQILQEDGIMITVGNNKKKGISKSDIVLNIDFSSNVINLYNIYENAIVINIKNKVVINKKRFNGICINDYDITYENFDNYDKDKATKYKTCEMYEAHMNKRQPFYEIVKKIKKDKVKITKLVGKNDVY